MNLLLDECVAALLNTKKKCEILPRTQSEFYNDKFFETYPIVQWGQIDWNIVSHNIRINNLEQISIFFKEQLKDISEPIYIIWGDISLPVIKCELADALKNIYEITPLGMYSTWLYCPTNGWVIEFFHEGDITLGFENEIKFANETKKNLTKKHGQSDAWWNR